MLSLRARALPALLTLLMTGVLVGAVDVASASADAGQAPAPAATSAESVALTATGPVRRDRATHLSATVRDATGQSLSGRTVTMQRGGGSVWTDVGTAVTDASGTAGLDAALHGDSTTYRAVLQPATGGTAAPTSDPVTVVGYRSATTTALSAPASVVDEQSATLTITARTTEQGADSTGVPALVEVQRRVGNGGWTSLASVRLDASGSGTLSVAPRDTTSYRVVTPDGDFWTGSTSPVATVVNLPPGTVVRLPAGAPEPRAMPAQPRATLPGAGLVVTKISNAQWARMKGVSWRRGCPVGRAGLRSIEVNYWAFDGYRRRGQLVVNAKAVRQFSAAFTRLYDARVPLRRIYPSETFGYSKASHGANDYLAMTSDDTSAFNCRWVTGRKHVRSPHATGFAVDINTFENPYLTVRDGWLPNAWWPSRSLDPIAWRSQSALVVSIMRQSGFSWTYGVKDAQHFDVRR